MASIPPASRQLPGGLASTPILLPIGVLIALLVWHTRAIVRVPSDPGQAAVHAAAPAELEPPADPPARPGRRRPRRDGGGRWHVSCSAQRPLGGRRRLARPRSARR